MKLKIPINLLYREEKDLFVLVMGLFLVIVFLLRVSTLPFRFDSLVVFFLYLLFTRHLIDDFRYRSYMAISFIGLLLTTLFSPYTTAAFFIVAIILYKKTRIFRY